MTVHCHYFSGTGTTATVGQALSYTLAAALNCTATLHPFMNPTARTTPLVADPDHIYLIGTPVIAGRIPNLLLPYLKSFVGNGARAIVYVLYGNRSFDDALAELDDLMTECGFQVIAAAALIGQHSFATKLATGRPNAEDLDAAKAFAVQVAEKIRTNNRQRPAVPGNHPAGPYYQPRDAEGNPIDIRKAKPNTRDTCTDCKRCAEICPLGSIEYDDCRVVSGICMKCCACIKICPVEAKYFDHPGMMYHKNDLENTFGAYKTPTFVL